jgi:hypothetical protein
MFVFRKTNAPPESRWCPNPPGKDSRARTPPPPCGTGSAGRRPSGWPSIARVQLLDPHLLAHPAPQVRASRADRRRGALGHRRHRGTICSGLALTPVRLAKVPTPSHHGVWRCLRQPSGTQARMRQDSRRFALLRRSPGSASESRTWCRPYRPERVSAPADG